MSDTWRFVPFDPKLPEDERRRITPLIPPPPEDEPVPQLRVAAVPDAWERQAGEGEDAWTRFRAYRDSPTPRRLQRPGAGNYQTLHKLAEEWRWFQRCEAYDRHFDKIKQQEIEVWTRQRAKDVIAEHRAILQDARDLCAIEVNRMLERAKASTVDGNIKPAELLKLMEVVFKYDRLSHDQSTENQGVVATEANLEHMTIDELREAQALAQKMSVKR